MSVLFLGKELFFSNQTLRSVQSEFGVEAQRHETLEQAMNSFDGAVPDLQMLVVDQLLQDDLLSRPEQYLEAAGSGCIAFAYRKEDAARSLFMHWDRKRHGDIGYLPMNVAPDVWRSILRLLLHDELFLPTIFVDSLESANGDGVASPARKNGISVAGPGDGNKKLYEQLTRREKQVLRLVSHGESNKIIASKLGITEHTVKLHMHNVVGKIGVSNRTAAAHFYHEVAPRDSRQGSVE
ncbi:helix-turn-helix transcriptional regulator [Ruegeria sediminis]|nr:response regulator transcription factor [Ruegeria sediminis]